MAVINVTPQMDITALIASDNVNEGDILLLEEGIYFQTVAVIKNNIRIVAKGPGVIFDGRSILLDAFILPDVVGVMIKGVNIRHYRASGILIEFGLGHRILNNKIGNMLEHGIEVMGSSSNLIWRNEICNCHDGVLLISGSTNNWVMENIAKDCFEDGFESVLGPDSNNAFISNTAIRSRFHGLDVYGSNNLLLNNLLLDNGLGVIINQGNGTIAIENMIKGTKQDTYIIFNGYFNHFAGESKMVCNRRTGIENNGQFNMIMNNEISYNGDTGLLLGTTSVLNLVMGNKLVCNIPENIIDNGTNNSLIDNIDKPCEACELPTDVCGNCFDEQ